MHNNQPVISLFRLNVYISCCSLLHSKFHSGRMRIIVVIWKRSERYRLPVAHQLPLLREFIQIFRAERRKFSKIISRRSVGGVWLVTGHAHRNFLLKISSKFKLESRDWSSWRLLKWAAGRWSQFGSKIAGRKITGNQQEHNEWLSVGPSACTSLIGWPFSETSSGRSKLTLRWKL